MARTVYQNEQCPHSSTCSAEFHPNLWDRPSRRYRLVLNPILRDLRALEAAAVELCHGMTVGPACKYCSLSGIARKPVGAVEAGKSNFTDCVEVLYTDFTICVRNDPHINSELPALRGEVPSSCRD